MLAFWGAASASQRFHHFYLLVRHNSASTSFSFQWFLRRNGFIISVCLLSTAAGHGAGANYPFETITGPHHQSTRERGGGEGAEGGSGGPAPIICCFCLCLVSCPDPKTRGPDSGTTLAWNCGQSAGSCRKKPNAHFSGAARTLLSRIVRR